MIKFLMFIAESLVYVIAAISLDAIYLVIRAIVITSTFLMYRSHELEYRAENARWRLVEHMNADKEMSH